MLTQVKQFLVFSR